MHRCLDLAQLGAGSVSPNPMVGAVLVYGDKIIGEGFHEAYGQSHAEVNALSSVPEEHKHLIQASTLYVSLEPCSITGKTPPCSTLIIDNSIKKVVISAIDYTPGVFQKSKKILTSNGIHVTNGILEEKGSRISGIRKKYVNTNHPYVILKYAQTKDHFIGKTSPEQFWISNKFIKRLVHKWRAEVDAILVGTRTAIVDDPSLTNRLYFGKSPIRILIDKNLLVPIKSNIFNEEAPTIVFNQLKNEKIGLVEWIKLDFSLTILPTLLNILHAKGIASLLVEGGAKTLQAFIDENLWDEARITTGNKYLKSGIPAPKIPSKIDHTSYIVEDQVDFYLNK